MKALFYGGAIASLAGMVMGMGMALPKDPPPSGPDAQPIAQQVATDPYGPVAYDAPTAYPPSYVIDAAYNSQPVTDLRAEAAPPSVYDDPAARIVATAWTDQPEAPAAAPQEVAAAGDTRPAGPATIDPETRTYASIDAVLSAVKADAPAPGAPL